MARTVGDLKILFDVLRGPDSGDALSLPVEVIGFGKTAKKLRIGILEGSGLSRVTPETQLAVRKAAQLLAYRGFELEPFRLNSLERALELWWFFFGTVVGELWEQEIRGREELLSPIFLDYLEAARPDRSQRMSMLQLVTMCAERDRERQRILEAMGDLPVLLSPVSAAPAFRHGRGSYKPGNGYRDTMRHSQWLNLAGFPGVTVPMGPVGKSPDELPIGVQIIGRPYEDELALAVAEQLEAERGDWAAPAIA